MSDLFSKLDQHQTKDKIYEYGQGHEKSPEEGIEKEVRRWIAKRLRKEERLAKRMAE